MSNIVPADALKKGAGHQGFETGYTVFAEGGRYEGTRGQGRFVDNKGKTIKQLKGSSGTRHQQNFLEAVRNRSHGNLAADLAIGSVSTGWCHLASIAALEAAENNAVSSAPVDGWQALQQAYQSQLAAWDEAAASDSAGAIEVNPDTGEVAATSSAAAQQLIKREYRSQKWEQEFEV